jgi:uncharacterized protein (TIGR02147 family)
MILKTNSPKQFLMQELERRQKINPRYSLRAFAKHMGLSPGELSEILKGKRKLSIKSAVRVSKALGLNVTESKYLLSLTNLDKGEGLEILNAQGPKSKEELSADVFHIISDWYCFAILNLADTKDFEWNTSYIAKRLGLTLTQAQSALERLERVGLLKNIKGKLQIDHDHVIATPGIPSEAIRSYHRSMLQKASDALDFQPTEQRDVSGVGFALDPKHIDSIRSEIAEFQENLLAKYKSGKKTEVYQIEIALFRLTEGAKHEN